MPRETGSGDEFREQRAEAEHGDAWQRIEPEKPERDRARKHEDAIHGPSEEFERAARPLPPDYGSDRPRHREISPELAAEFGKTPEQIHALRAKMFDENAARAQRHADGSDTSHTRDTEPAAERAPRPGETRTSADTLEPAEGEQPPRSTVADTVTPSAGESNAAREAPPPWDLHTRLGDGKDAPFAKQVLDRYAGPDGLTTEQRVEDERYIMTHAKDRPWLSIAANQEPEVRRVYVERDRAEGHDPARHDGWRDAPDQEQRTAAGKDPAHPTDSPAYHNAVDHLGRPPPPDHVGGKRKQHAAGEHATWIADPTAWAVATARAIDHPDVQRAFASDEPPPRVEVPLEDVLGPDGHRKCQGYTLDTDGFNSRNEAMKNRDAWVAEVRDIMRNEGMERDQAEGIVEQKVANGQLELIKPEVKRIATFEGGTCQIRLRVNDRVVEGISTICYNPPTKETKGT